MQSFLPPTPAQVSDMANFIQLLTVASDKDVQAVVKQMKDLSDSAIAAQAAAAQSINDANAKLKEAQDLVDSVAADQADVAKRQAQIEADSHSLDDRAKQIDEDRTAWEAEKAAVEKDLADRISAVTSRENNIDEREKEASDLAETSKKAIADYEAKTAKLQKTLSGG